MLPGISRLTDAAIRLLLHEIAIGGSTGAEPGQQAPARTAGQIARSYRLKGDAHCVGSRRDPGLS
jgi:hypothetical protein